ncbi:hypothetical protein DY000_02020771 [Brassica cretica]|uniref:Uncharacterized protein n=1 Tax=Brassica cretica TaxID=69181 RepID=A0ABQ7E2L4_BRACR|nr:hypothetical protein DY000_02020771 [Brassica cretica]
MFPIYFENFREISRSVSILISSQRLGKVYGIRSVEVLLDTPPGSPKNCPEAKGGYVRVQISLSRPVSFFMVKPRSVEVEISSVQSSQDVHLGFWPSPLRSISCFSPRTL